MIQPPEAVERGAGLSEFDLIRTFFADLGAPRADVALGVGDDCALLEVPPGHQLAVSLDTLTAGVHFFADCDPVAIGHKALAVGLSDLAAMGAEPAWATLALSLPEVDATWLRGLREGLGALAEAHRVRLVGGDTTRGPLSLTLQLHGFVPFGQAIRRAGARPGDQLWVSGTLGDAGLALRRLFAGEEPEPEMRVRLERPTPRVALGLGLRALATAMIDVSDGLAADLGHLLAASGVAAEVSLAELPLSPPVARALGEGAGADWALALASGDDYELCFSAPPEASDAIRALGERLDCPLTPIGLVIPGAGARWQRPEGGWLTLGRCGHDHFSEPS